AEHFPFRLARPPCFLETKIGHVSQLAEGLGPTQVVTLGAKLQAALVPALGFRQVPECRKIYVSVANVEGGHGSEGSIVNLESHVIAFFVRLDALRLA